MSREYNPTPTPWTREGGTIVKILEDGTRLVIATRYSWRRYNAEGEVLPENGTGIEPVEADANAAYIVKACNLFPELVTALAELVRAIMYESGAGADILPVHPENDPDYYRLIQQARALLDKCDK